MQIQSGNSLESLFQVNAPNDELRRKGRLLSVLILVVWLALLLFTLADWFYFRSGESENARFIFLTDGGMLLLLVGLWWLNRRGYVQIATWGLLIQLIVGTLLLFDFPSLERSLMIMFIPVTAASFLICPPCSILFAILSIAGYSLVYGLQPAPGDYNYVAVIGIFGGAVLSWMLANHLEVTFTQLRGTIEREEKDQQSLKLEISERQRAEADLKISLARRGELEFIVNHSPAVAFLWRNEPGWPVDFVSENVTQFGYNPATFMQDNTSFAEIIYPEDLPGVVEQTNSNVVQNLTNYVLRYRVVKPGGELVWVEEYSWMRRDTQGKVTHFQGVVLDVSRRVEAELATQHWMEQMAILNALGREIAASLELPEIGRLVFSYISRMVDCPNFGISLYHEGPQSITAAFMMSDSEEYDPAMFPPLVHDPERKIGGRSLAIATAMPVVVDDPEKDMLDCGGISVGEGEQPLSALYVPMVVEGHVIGLIEMQSYHKDAYSKEDNDLMVTVANQIGLSVQSARLFEQTRQRNREMEVVESVSAALRLAHNRAEMLPVILEQAYELVNAEAGVLLVCDPVGAAPSVAQNLGSGCPPVGQLLGKPGDAPCNVNPFEVGDFQQDEKLAVTSISLVAQDEMVGCAWLARKNPYNEEEECLLQAIGNIAMNAINRATLHEETEWRAEQLSLLYYAGLTLNSMLEPQDQIEYLFKIAMEAIGADRVEFHEYDMQLEILRFELEIGYPKEELPALYNLVFQMNEGPNLLSDVVHDHLILNLADVREDPRYLMVDPAIISAIWVPVERAGQLLGVLGMSRTRLAPFKEQDEQMLTLFANQAGVAMENTRLFGETRRRLEHLQALQAVDQAITSSLDLRVTLDILLKQVLKQLKVDAASVLLHNRHSQTLEYAAALGFRSRVTPGVSIRLGEEFAGRVALDKQIMHRDHFANMDGGTWSKMCAQEGFVEYYGVPLVATGQVKGVLEIYHRTALMVNVEWLDFLNTLAGQAAIALDKAELFEGLQRSNIELGMAYDNTIEGWARAMEIRDHETGGHSDRVTALTLQLGQQMGFDEDDLMQMRRGALLHDIGKIGVPDQILLKPGPLTPEEWEIMRKHPVFAYQLLSPISYLQPALDIPYCHHERWDGTGYPRGLKGEEIPLGARIFAVVDIWDALISDRPYRKAWSHQAAAEYIRNQGGDTLDPRVVEIFIQLLEETGAV